MRRTFACAILTATVLCAAAAEPQQAESKIGSGEASQEAKLLRMPLGDEVGVARNAGFDGPNPQASNPAAVKAGEALFRNMNCAYCHGLKAKGVIGPSLTDGYWRYGGTPALIFKSIAEGRPEGMPAWRSLMSAQAIWDIVAYIQSLGGTNPAGHLNAAMDGDLAKGSTQPGAGLLPVTQGSY